MKKKTNKTNPQKDVLAEMKEEFKRHTTVLMEHMTKEVKTVTEQYGALAKETSEIKSDVKGLKEDMAIVKPAVEGLSKDMKEAKSELSSVKYAVMDISKTSKDHGKRIEKLEEKVHA